MQLIKNIFSKNAPLDDTKESINNIDSKLIDLRGANNVIVQVVYNVGNLPKQKAEQLLENIKNNISKTFSDDRFKFMIIPKTDNTKPDITYIIVN